MPEILLHYIWQKGLFLRFPQFTTDGCRVEVLSTGRHNNDAGPDFTDVHIRMDGVELVGQVEIHVNSSDWYRHHHQNDSAYDKVLLHVVRHADKPVYNSQGQPIPQLELSYNQQIDYIGSMLRDAQHMDTALYTHQCGHYLLADPSLLSEGWKKSMLVRRLDCKKESIERLLSVSQNDWNHAFYVSLAHSFGFHTNGVPMELLAQATPLSVLAKHRADIDQLRALLLGQAGLLSAEHPLWQEYCFLRAKFQLTPLSATVWKQGRMRPQARPSVRIEQLAQLIQHTEFLLSCCLEATDVKTLRNIFVSSGMGQSSVDSLLINTVVPFMYARGQQHKAMRVLEQLPAEDNRIVLQWQVLGQLVCSAADTQALIHLYTTCCEPNRCSACAVWSELPVTPV